MKKLKSKKKLSKKRRTAPLKRQTAKFDSTPKFTTPKLTSEISKQADGVEVLDLVPLAPFATGEQQH